MAIGKTAIEAVGVTKIFQSSGQDSLKALDNVSVTIGENEFFTLLGPSGCGKTTLLRLIAGFDFPTDGQILLHGKDIAPLPPFQRPVNTVFQNYALFPHMNVAGNIAYGLRVRKAAKAQIREKVAEMLRLVQLEGYEKRNPDSLSGGQRQRVAIARAIVLAPDILLLDEPLGALDLQLRRQMQTELKALQERLGITFIYITHDQEEALNMSDRIALMRDGVLEQIGTPEDIYENPATRFAATFIGQTNLLDCQVAGEGALSLSGHAFPARLPEGGAAPLGAPVSLCLRMERVHVAQKAPEGQWSLPATLTEHRFASGLLRSTVSLPGGQPLTAITQNRAGVDPGGAVRVWWDEKHAAVIL